MSIRNLILVLVISAIFSQGKCQESDPRIVNGFNVTSSDGFKHQVSIRAKANELQQFGSGHMCGGSLISAGVVLTAAHCVYNEDTRQYNSPSLFVVVLGSLDRTTRDANTLFLDVTKIVGHDRFNTNTFANDIALMHLSQNVSSNHPTVQPIRLATTAPVAGTACQISGWGSLVYQGTYEPIRLQAGNVSINSMAECNLPNRYNGFVTAGMFCAGRFSGTNLVDSCQGDSGGPLTCNGVLVGIVSNGVECARANFPGIYVDVNSYRNWIDDPTSPTPTNAPTTTSTKGSASTMASFFNILTISSAFLLSFSCGKRF